jgi:GAF domain-containing protein
MVDGRWQFIADKIRTADTSLAIGHSICVAARELLGATSASLALVIDHAYRPIAATDDLGTLLDDEQFALGDGPTFDAQSSPAPVILEDTHAHREALRWPVFVGISQKHGIHAAMAIPLRIGDAHLGVLTAYRVRPGEPSAQEYIDGLILASLATAELLSLQAGGGRKAALGVFEPGLYDQSVLQVAAGMVAEALNISIIAALVRIRARAFADDQPVSRTAQRIVDRELVLDKWPGAEGEPS